MTSSGKYSAFISYASENREKADEICAGLEQRGLVCWIAPRNIRAGREYADEIIHGLERSEAVVLVLSQAANTSVFVLREIERAVSKDINVVPVRIEEVTPSPGLELFISGTHWMDVWRGDWDDHMDRLVRDLNDGSTPAPVDTSIHRSVPPHRSLRMLYVAAGLAVALSAIVWFWREPAQVADGPASQEAVPAVEMTTTPPPAIIDPGPATNVVPKLEEVQADATPPGERPLGGIAGRGPGTARSAPAARPPAATAAARPPASTGNAALPPAVDTSGELNRLRDDYDKLSLRGEVIDEALNQLWEQMKPNSPRLDMVTHQRSLKTNLTRSRDALAGRDAAEARRYLERAQADLAVLEEFLNR